MSNPSRSSSSGHHHMGDSDDELEMLSFEEDPSSKRGQSSEEDSITTSLLQGEEGNKESDYKKLRGEPKTSSQTTNTGGGGAGFSGSDGKESFWWIRHNEGALDPERWRHSNGSSISTVYHSAEDITDFMSEISTNSGDTLRSHQSYHSILRNGAPTDLREEPEDIFSSPLHSPVAERKVR